MSKHMVNTHPQLHGIVSNTLRWSEWIKSDITYREGRNQISSAWPNLNCYTFKETQKKKHTLWMQKEGLSISRKTWSVPGDKNTGGVSTDFLPKSALRRLHYSMSDYVKRAFRYFSTSFPTSSWIFILAFIIMLLLKAGYSEGNVKQKAKPF